MRHRYLWGYLREEMRRALNWRLAIAILAGISVPMYAIWGDMMQAIQHPEPWRSDSLSIFTLMNFESPISFVLPILCVLPYSISFCEEYQSGSYLLAALRGDMRSYIASRLLACGISGAATTGMITALQAVLCLCVFPFYNSAQDILSGSYSNYSIYPALVQNIGIANLVYFSYSIALSMLFGAIWSIAGMALAARIPDRFIVVSSPFIIVFSLHFLASRIKMIAFSPVNLLNPLMGSLGYALVFGVLLLGMGCIAYGRGVLRRVRNG